MTKTAKNRLIRYGCCAGFTVLMGVLYIGMRNFFGLDLIGRLRILCDAFTLPGVLLVMSGCAVWLRNEGMLDAVAFLGTGFKALFSRKHGKPIGYSDYVEQRKEKRVKGYGFLFISGAVDLLISGLFLALYYSIRG